MPPDETLEPFGQGRLWLFQKKQGYRFSLDAVLLAGLTSWRPPEKIMDLGAGCGIVSLILARRFPGASVVGVECQPDLADLARRNVLLNGLSKQVHIRALAMQDLPRHYPPAAFDLLVSNPPYRPVGAGRLNPDSQKAIARHELQGSLEVVAHSAAYLLPPRGRLAVLYPAWRLVHLCTVLRSHRLEPKTLRLIHSRPGEEACLVWLEARRNGREELKVLPPLVIYQTPGEYTGEMHRIFNF